MRRGRNLREFRHKLLKGISGPASVKKNLNKRILSKLSKKKEVAKNSPIRIVDKVSRIRNRNRQVKKEIKFVSKFVCPTFKNFSDYECDTNIKVCHYIDSLGLGGAQTMMCELVNGLNKYYSHLDNFIVYIEKSQSFDSKLYESYNVSPVILKSSKDFTSFCDDNKIDVVVHHRTAPAKCIKHLLPKQCGYVLINHTWNNMAAVKNFNQCDCYISVCQFLHNKTKWPNNVTEDRVAVILNGVENDYIDDLESLNDDYFKTGRCHRLVSNKFRIDSVHWMENTVIKKIPNFKHYIIGTNKEAKALAKKYDFLNYLGTVTDRMKKMSIINNWDVYFYETFGEEGASIAVLESLACGVPVLCRDFGGNKELVSNGVNGYIVKDKDDFLNWFTKLSSDQSILNDLRNKTIEDFNNRLHIKHAACKYAQIFEALKNVEHT